MLLLRWCPFKMQKEKWPGLQFTRTDFLSLVLTPLRIRWTIPLKRQRGTDRTEETQERDIGEETEGKRQRGRTEG